MPAFKYGVIRSVRTDEHFGAFWDAAISSVDEVAEHFAVADQIERQSDAIHIYLPDTDAYADPVFVYRKYPIAPSGGLQPDEWEESKCVQTLDLFVAGDWWVDMIGATVSPASFPPGAIAATPFEFALDVEHFRCTPWKDEDGVAAINIVVRFSSDRTGVAPAGPARAAAFVKRAKAGFLKLRESQGVGMPHWGPWRPEFGVNELYGAWCTACADGYKQFRIASMREGVRVTGTNRCPFMEGLDHKRLATKASVNVPGKDSKEVMQQFNQHEFVNDQRAGAGYLDLAAGGDAASVKLAPVTYATTGHGAAWFTHAITGDPLLSYSEVEGFGAGALIRNACGAGYDHTKPHEVTCDCKRGTEFRAKAYADAASGAIVRIEAINLGRDYYKRPKCHITPAQNSLAPPSRVCHITPTVLAGEIPGMTLAGAVRQVTDTLGGRSFRLVGLATGASSPGPGTYAFQLVLSFLPPVRYEDMLCWKADVPARVALPARASIVPSNTASYCYRALPDSAAGEVYLQRPRGINPVGCNLKCTAGVACHRTFEQQEQCRPYAEWEWLLGGVQGGLAARMDQCKGSLAVEAQLLPFLLPLEEAIFVLEGVLLKCQLGGALLSMRDSALQAVDTLASAAEQSRQGMRGALMLGYTRRMRQYAAQLCLPWHTVEERVKQCPAETFRDEEDDEEEEEGVGGADDAGIPPPLSTAVMNKMRIAPLRAAAARRGLVSTGNKREVLLLFCYA